MFLETKFVSMFLRLFLVIKDDCQQFCSVTIQDAIELNSSVKKLEYEV